MEMLWLIFFIFLSSVFGFCVAAALAVSIIKRLKKENHELTSSLVSKKERLGEYKKQILESALEIAEEKK